MSCGTKLRHGVGACWNRAHEVEFKTSIIKSPINFNGIKFPNSEIRRCSRWGSSWATSWHRVRHVWKTLLCFGLQHISVGFGNARNARNINTSRPESFLPEMQFAALSGNAKMVKNASKSIYWLLIITKNNRAPMSGHNCTTDSNSIQCT